jgi:hypothetical protein
MPAIVRSVHENAEQNCGLHVLKLGSLCNSVWAASVRAAFNSSSVTRTTRQKDRDAVLVGIGTKAGSDVNIAVV